MDFLTLAKNRYSCREYLERPVEEEKLSAVLEAGRVAPTACNRQPLRLLVLRSREGLARLGKASRTFGAPLAVVVCADKEEAWVRKYDGKSAGDIDASIVTDHMMLKATELGLGSVWVCNFKPEVLREEWNLPARLEPVNILYLGYAAGLPKSPERHEEERKPLSALVSYESVD